MSRIHRIALAAVVSAALSAPAVAQQQNYSQVSQADIQRLQDSVTQATTEVQQLRNRDASRASQLQTQLDDVRDEVIYLKVKLRKEGSLQRSDYASVRDRLDDLRSQATNSTPSTGNTAGAAGTTANRAAGGTPTTSTQSSTTRSATSTAATGSQVEVPSGTEMDVRLTNNLNSGTAQVEDRFEGTTVVDLNINGRTVIPAGSVMRGVVSAVEPATRTNRTAKMTVSFDQVTVNGRVYPIRGTVTQAIQGEGLKGETGRIATGAGAGAILGGILGGVKGAVLGAVIGGGGITAATEGKEIDLPQGTVLRVRLDSPVSIQPAR
jgi:hypothetical protein